MRRLPAALVASVIVLAACGDDGGTDDSSSTTTAVSAEPGSTTAGGTEGTAGGSTTAAPTTVPRPTLPKPTVPVPTAQPAELVITDLTEGTGDPAEVGDTVFVHYVGVLSADGTEFDNSYDRGEPFSVTLGGGQVIAGWDQGLVGAKAGGQRRLDIPAALAYGANPPTPEIPVDANLTFVIDVVAVVAPVDPSDEPTLVIDPRAPASEVTSEDLVLGTGATAELGANATFSYQFYRGDTGEKIFTSWDKQPATITLEKVGQVDGLIDGMLGMQVGGRRLISIPAAQMFGGLGNEDLGLPVGTDLIAVIDLLAAY